MQSSKLRQGVWSNHYKPRNSILWYHEIKILRMECKARDQDEMFISHHYEPIMEAVRSNPCIFLPLEILKQVDCPEIIVILSQF